MRKEPIVVMEGNTMTLGTTVTQEWFEAHDGPRESGLSIRLPSSGCPFKAGETVIVTVQRPREPLAAVMFEDRDGAPLTIRDADGKAVAYLGVLPLSSELGPLSPEDVARFGSALVWAGWFEDLPTAEQIEGLRATREQLKGLVSLHEADVAARFDLTREQAAKLNAGATALLRDGLRCEGEPE